MVATLSVLVATSASARPIELPQCGEYRLAGRLIRKLGGKPGHYELLLHEASTAETKLPINDAPKASALIKPDIGRQVQVRIGVKQVKAPVDLLEIEKRVLETDQPILLIKSASCR